MKKKQWIKSMNLQNKRNIQYEGFSHIGYFLHIVVHNNKNGINYLFKDIVDTIYNII